MRRIGGIDLARALSAVLVGNAAYFWLLAPQLPKSWQHQPFVFDRGLLLDFWLCVAAYFLLRWLGKRIARSW